MPLRNESRVGCTRQLGGDGRRSTGGVGMQTMPTLQCTGHVRNELEGGLTAFVRGGSRFRDSEIMTLFKPLWQSSRASRTGSFQHSSPIMEVSTSNLRRSSAEAVAVSVVAAVI